MVTRKQFAGSEYANQIRSLCLEIAVTEESLIFDGVDQQAARAKLKALKSDQIGLGITPNCKVHLDQSAYEDADTMAAYVAGQWLLFIDKPVIPRQAVANIIMEHSQCQSGPIREMPGKDLPAYARNTLAVQIWIREAARYLDLGKEEQKL